MKNSCSLVFILLFFNACGVNDNQYINKECNISTYSIDIYKGETPFDIKQINQTPIFTACNLKDIDASFVADPFLIKKDNIYFLFFEFLNRNTDKGEIGLATSKDLNKFNFDRVVLEEDFHLSYPQVFLEDGKYYMIPESYHSQSIRLYKFSNFPYQLEFVREILSGKKFVDNTLFKYNGIYYIFTTNPYNSELRLYYSFNLAYDWIEHPKSPIIVNNKNIARPGGNIFTYKNKVYRVTQDDYPTYGNQVRAIEITKLTVDDYKEDTNNSKIIVKASDINGSWNEMGMHQLDMHYINGYYYGIVDGKRKVE